MADPTPLNDPATYQKMAADAYAKRASQGVLNPRAVMAGREADQENSPANTAVQVPVNAAMNAQGVRFTKGFTPQERSAQKAALYRKLAEMHEGDASSPAAVQTGDE